MNFAMEQQQYAERAVELAFGGADSLASILIVGRSGVGKAAVAKAMADLLDLEFVNVPMNDSGQALRERLAGSLEQAQRAAEEGSAPGELGRNRPALLYLDKLHAMDTALAQFLQQAITQRRYFDAQGRECLIQGDLLIVGGLRIFEPEARITREHFVCTAFPHFVEVRAPTKPEDLRLIAAGMLSRLAPGRVLAADVDALLLLACHEPDHLHTLFRWMSTAESCSADGSPINLPSLQLARNDDIEFHLRRIDYCASSPSVGSFREWQAKFPEEIRPLAVVIVREIAERYYIARGRYWGALDALISEAKIPPGASVIFCKWQAYGKSGPAVMQHLKNRCAWNAATDIDLTYPCEQWRRLPDHRPPRFILTDDFTGTGSTVCSLWERGQRPLIRLLEQYPHSRAYLLIVVGLSEGLRRVTESLGRYRDRVRLCVGVRLGDEDRCFSEGSRIFPDPAQRAKMKAFCEGVGREYGFPPNMWLGYDDSQSLVVFPHTVPNNSLPILWHDQGRWKPLLPASGVPNRR